MGPSSTGSFAALAAEQPFSGVTRRTLASERATVTRYDFEPGARFPIHRHAQEQITLVERGEVEFDAGGTVASLGAGDWSVVAPNVPHGVRAGPNGARILAIIVPRREAADDYQIESGDG
jgi:quercetin dioxygenase-like cupin family protein